MLIAVIAVIVFLSILILVHELGHFWAAKKFGLLVEEFGFGLPPKLWRKKIGETTYSLNALPFGGFVKIFGEDGDVLTGEIKDKSRNFVFLPAWKKFIVLVAGVFMNFLLGWLVISIVLAIGTPPAVFVADVAKDSPAQAAGISANDRISGFTKIEDFISFVDQNRGKEILLKITAPGGEKEVKITPRINPPAGQGALGVSLVEGGMAKSGVLESIWEGLKLSGRVFATIFVALFGLIKTAVLGQAGLEGVTGPVGIVRITAQAGSMGFVYLLQLLAVISLNLAAINIFPFPALDGGRILFLLIEKIKGSPLPRKFERYANLAGLIFLLLLLVFITIKDIRTILF